MEQKKKSIHSISKGFRQIKNDIHVSVFLSYTSGFHESTNYFQ